MTLVREDAPRREDAGDGYYNLRYVVRNTESGTVGTYGLFFAPDGTVYGASRDYHYPTPPDYVTPEYGTKPHFCEFVGGKAVCDGSSLVPRHDSEEDRWREAEMMAR